MSDSGTSHGNPEPARGAATAGKGTPMSVEVSSHRGTRTLLAVFLAGPVIWSAHFLIVYLVVEAGCTGSGPGLSAFGPPVPEVATLLVTAVAALGCLLTTFWGYRRWRADQSLRYAGLGPQRPGHGGTLAFAGILLSLLGFISVLFVGVPALFLPACLP